MRDYKPVDVSGLPPESQKEIRDFERYLRRKKGPFRQGAYDESRCQRNILRAKIEASGLSARRFAREILLRDERTVRRWLAGDSPIPLAVLRFLDPGYDPLDQRG